MAEKLAACPNCKYMLVENPSYCPFCGIQLRHPAWKRAGAWVILVMLLWGLARCHIELFKGLDGFSGPVEKGEQPATGGG